MSMTESAIRVMPDVARAVLPYVMASRYYTTPEQIEYRRQSSAALRDSGLFSPKIARRVDVLQLQFSADQMFVNHAAESVLAKMKPRIDESHRNTIAVRRLVAEGRPMLFGCSYFGCLYYALLALEGLVKDLLVITSADPSPVQHLFEKIGSIAGIQMHVMGANEPMVGVAILRQLKRGASVATMLDCYYGKNIDLASDFLGRPAASPGILYGLASKASAVVVPTACIRNDKANELKIGPVADMKVMSVDQTSSAVNGFFSELVRDHPEQWMGWPNLLTRWNQIQLQKTQGETV